MNLQIPQPIQPLDDSKKSKIPNWVNWVILGVVVLVVGGMIWWARSIFYYMPYSMPSTSAPLAPFSLCETNSDCIHIIADEESFSPGIESFTYQDCINKNYEESDLKWYGYGRIIEKTGKDLCECRQDKELKMCAFKKKSGEEINTSNWKTYRNEEYGFEIKYPLEFSVWEGADGYFRLGIPVTRGGKSDGAFDLYFSELRVRGNLTLDQFIHNNATYQRDEYQYQNEGDGKINGARVFWYTLLLGSGNEKHYFFSQK